MSDLRQLSREVVLEAIKSEPEVWVRVAVLLDKAEWRPALFDMVAGAKPARWHERSWSYDEACLRALKVSGVEICQWAMDGQARIGDLDVKLPSVYESLSGERHQSMHDGVYETLDWPVMEYTLNGSELKRGSGIGPLIGDGCPSFFQFQAAAAYFFGVPLAGRNIESGPWMFRRQDLSGRVRRVRLKPTGTEVHVDGSALLGTVVELAGDVPGQQEVIALPTASQADGPHEMVVEFPGDLSRNAWVLLKRDRLWVDRRFLNWGYRTTVDDGVEQVVERETHLEALISGGEGPGVEFKVELPPRQASGEQLKFLHTVAAFANSDGGSILFGVADDGKVVGLDRDQVDGRTRDRITTLVRAQVAPLPQYSVEVYDVEGEPGKVVLVLQVEPGPAPPYGVKPGSPSYYIRRGATTFPAAPEQVRALARSRPPEDPGRHALWG